MKRFKKIQNDILDIIQENNELKEKLTIINNNTFALLCQGEYINNKLTK